MMMKMKLMMKICRGEGVHTEPGRVVQQQIKLSSLCCVSHQVSISEADLQAMGGTITMVTQEGTTITIPAHELATQGAHSVTMVTTDGSDEQVNTD